MARLREIRAIKKALKATAKKPITDKNKELSDRMLTDALRGRFAREIDKLNLSRMPVELRKEKDRRAVSYFRVALVDQPNTKVGEIFSEGEHRCVALAAFLRNWSQHNVTLLLFLMIPCPRLTIFTGSLLHLDWWKNRNIVN